MHTRLLLVGACLVLGLPVQASAQEAESRAIIDKALKAQGGEKLVQSLKTSQAKAKGTISVGGMDLDFTMEMFTNAPDQLKLAIQLNVMNNIVDLVNIVNGDKGWASAAGQVLDLTAEQLKDTKDQIYAESVTNLFPLREKDNGFSFASLGETKVGDKAVVGVQVAKKGKRDVNLFFDKQTSLLVKAEYRAIDPFSKQEVTQMKLFSDYKELVPGLKIASKVSVKNDGNKFLDMEVTELRTVERHDASVFAKPN